MPQAAPAATVPPIVSDSLICCCDPCGGDWQRGRQVGQTFRVSSAAPDPAPSGMGVVAVCHGVEVPDGPHLSADRIASLQDGTFAEVQVRGALAAIRPADRVLHLGAADGVLSAIIARNCRPALVLGFERDAALVARARALHRHNGLDDRTTLRHGEVLAGQVDPRFVEVESGPVPVTGHDRLRRSFLHNVIVLDIDGAERVFLRRANLSGVRLMLVDLHPAVYGRDGVRDCRRALGRAGYERDLGLSGAEMDVYRRVRA